MYMHIPGCTSPLYNDIAMPELSTRLLCPHELLLVPVEAAALPGTPDMTIEAATAPAEESTSGGAAPDAGKIASSSQDGQTLPCRAFRAAADAAPLADGFEELLRLQLPDTRLCRRAAPCTADPNHRPRLTRGLAVLQSGSDAQPEVAWFDEAKTLQLSFLQS